MNELQHSGKRTPCPVCGRTKDKDCSWSEDNKTVLCHTYSKEIPPTEINGYWFTGKYCDDGIHGADSAAIFSQERPGTRPGPARRQRVKSAKEKDRDVQLTSAHIESQVDDLILRIASGVLTTETAHIELTQWCKEYSYDKFSATRLLTKKLKSVEVNEPEEKCRLARRVEKIESKIGTLLRFNDMRGQVELDGKPVEIEDLRIKLALNHNIDIPARDCDQVCLYLAKKQRYNPVVEYLNSCTEKFPASENLLSERVFIQKSIKSILGVSKELHVEYVKRTLIAAVARACAPGCKVDTVCILVGKQGAGKSTFWAMLAGEWFDDSMGSHSDKDERLKLHQSWIVEWSEIENIFKRKDISAVKSFLTTRIDHLRKPYGRVIEAFHRPSIITGSTNFDEFLADSTGNRRFWVVPCPGSIDTAQLAEIRDQLWAAAVHLYNAGTDWQIPAHLVEEAAAESEDYQLSDPWEGPVQAYLEGRSSVTTAEILSQALGIEVARHDRGAQMRVSALLKLWGWVQTRERQGDRCIRGWKKSFLGNKVGSSGSVNIEGRQGEGLRVIQPLIQPPDQRLDQVGSDPDPAMIQPLPVIQPPDQRLDHFETLENSGVSGVVIRMIRMIQPDHQDFALFFKNGDQVEILTGGFSGRTARVVEVCDDHVWVKAATWRIRRRYEFDQVRRVE
jgi:predicted P-loop ATPase